MTSLFSRALRPLLASLWLALLPLLALAGTPVLTLQATVAAGAGVDATAFVDQVEIVNAITGAVVANAVPNAGFETPAQAVGGFAYNPNGAGVSWTFTANAGVARPGGGFEPPSPSPEGNQVAFLQTNGGVGSLSQTLPSLAAGTYQLRLQLAQRDGNSTPQSVRVLVDGNVIGTFTPPSSTAYTSYLSTAFVVDAVLQVEAVGSASRGTTADVTAFVDQVELLNVSAGTSPAVTNAGFETTGSLGTGSFGYTPTGTGWSFAGNSGLATNGSPFGNPTAPGPTHVALLQSKSNGSGSFSQALPTALPMGSYRVRLYGAQRTATAPADQVVRVLLNGLEVGRFQPTAGFVQYTLPSASTSLTLSAPPMLTEPTLTAISPFIGLPGSVLTLTGLRLTGATSITFTGAAGVKTVTSGFTVNAAGTSITGIVVPDGARSGPVTVTAPTGTSAVTNGLFFSRATTLAIGYSYGAAVQADGSLWTWGSNNRGQLGLGYIGGDQDPPRRVGTLNTWASVSAGRYHMVGVQTDGSLWTWGENGDGQLGQGTTTDLGTPTRVGTLNSWVSVAASINHTVALQADGSLWAWGDNLAGQLGQDNTTDLSTPTRVGTLNSWVSATAGGMSTIAVQADGSLWAWGHNDNRQLGVGNSNNQLTPVRMGADNNWVNAVVSEAHAAGVRADGSLWAWGSNDRGQLGQGNAGTYFNNPSRIGAGTSWGSAAVSRYHTLAVQADGSLWACGSNSDGQLGQGTTTSLNVLTRVGTGTSWVSAAADWANSAGQQSCQGTWTWGQGAFRALGNGSTDGQLSPVLVIPPISLVSFAPASAAVGATVVVTGTGLAGLTALTVNGASALASVTGNTATGFSFVVPAAATKTGTVSVAAGCGTAGSTAFTVILPPTIGSFTPTSGPVGMSVTLTGTNLSGATSVSFNGTAQTTISNNTDTSLTVAVPYGASTGPLTVTTPGGTSPASTQVFTVIPPPTISSFTPASGPTGTTVALTGTGLGSPSTVRVNGTPGTVLGTPAATATGFSFTVGSGSTSGAITLATVSGVATTTLTPVLRLQASGGSSGDRTVYLDQVELLTLNGSVVSGGVANGSFETGAPAGDLTTPGTAVASWTFGGNARLSTTASAYTPPAPPDGSAHLALLQNAGPYLEQALSLAAGTYQLRFQLAQRQCCYDGPYDLGIQVSINGVPLGATLTTTSENYAQLVSLPFSVSGAGTFTITPGITSLNTVAELPGRAVVLTGTGFTNASTVSFGGTAASSVTYNSPTSLTAVVPAGAAPGSSAVVVRTAGISSPGSPAFEVLQVYRSATPSGCLSTEPLVLNGTGGSGAWRYLRMAGAGGAVVAAIEDTYNLGTVTAGINALGTATSDAVRRDGRTSRRYLDRNFYLSASNPSFPGQTVRVRFFGLSSELTRLTAVDANATAATLNASQYDGANVNCDLTDNDPNGQRRLLAAPAIVLAGADWFTAQVSVADHFSEFYLTGASAPLPVQLTTFTATAAGPRAARLAWATASEKNSAYFAVERSPDGKAWHELAQVPAAGHSSAPRAYKHTDAARPAGPTSYYRLRQVDADGAVAYSPVRVLAGAEGATGLTLFPNPAHGAATLTDATPGTLVLVLDALGRPVATATADAAGTAQLVLPVGLAAGVYIVRSGAQVRRLTVE